MKVLTILIVALFAFSLNANSQNTVISKFTWDLGSVTDADIGPDATSVSTSATNSTGGVSGTKGLNPSLPQSDVKMTLPGSYFNMDGFVITFEFKRNVSQAIMLSRGEDFKISLNGGQLGVKYKVEDMYGANPQAYNSGNLVTIPKDDQFHTIRYAYDPLTGICTVELDGTQVWLNDGPDHRVISWDTALDLEIGEMLDGGGDDIPVMDNLIIESTPTLASILPVTLEYFAADYNDGEVTLDWATASESNNAYFTVERSNDLNSWETITVISGSGNSISQNIYNVVDKVNGSGSIYYRLSQTDFDGTTQVLKISSVEIENVNSQVSLYPNPVESVLFIELDETAYATVQLYAINGAMVKEQSLYQNLNSIDVSDMESGIYIVKINSNNEMIQSKKLFVK